jgi:hypothetical protein
MYISGNLFLLRLDRGHGAPLVWLRTRNRGPALVEEARELRNGAENLRRQSKALQEKIARNLRTHNVVGAEETMVDGRDCSGCS